MLENVNWNAVFQSFNDTWLPLFFGIVAIIVVIIIFKIVKKKKNR